MLNLWHAIILSMKQIAVCGNSQVLLLHPQVIIDELRLFWDRLQCFMLSICICLLLLIAKGVVHWLLLNQCIVFVATVLCHLLLHNLFLIVVEPVDEGVAGVINLNYFISIKQGKDRKDLFIAFIDVKQLKYKDSQRC